MYAIGINRFVCDAGQMGKRIVNAWMQSELILVNAWVRSELAAFVKAIILKLADESIG